MRYLMALLVALLLGLLAVVLMQTNERRPTATSADGTKTISKNPPQSW